MNARNDNDWRPAPEDLAAYVDGELDARRLRELEGWLRQNPEMAAELQAHKQLARLWRRTAPETPAAASWSVLRRNIEAGFLDRTRPARIPGRWWVGPLALATVAASALFGFLVLRQVWYALNDSRKNIAEEIAPDRDDADASRSSGEVQPESILEVLAPDEVEIITLDLRDRNALVVGELPIKEPLALLTQDEVTVDQIEQDDTQRRPEVSTEPPMLWVPTRPAER